VGLPAVDKPAQEAQDDKAKVSAVLALRMRATGGLGLLRLLCYCWRGDVCISEFP
jgi:hypothetical protein